MTKMECGSKDKNYVKFVSDCQRRGLAVEYTEEISDPRPFVRCTNPFDAKEATDVKVQWIRKQSRYIVFPVKSKMKGVRFNSAI